MAEPILETPEDDGAQVDDNINVDAEPEPTEVAEPETDESGETVDPIEKSKEGTPKWFQKRMDEMTWKINEERRQREELQRKLDEKTVSEAKIPEFNKPKPVMENFDYNEDFLDALTDWKLEKRDYENQEKARVQTETTERTKQVNTFEQKRTATMERGISKYEDFTQAVGSLPAGVMSEPVAAALVETSNSEDVAYYLGKNVSEAQRISKLNPLNIAIELGAISTKLALKPIKTTTSAPPPITPITGSKGNVQKDPSQMTDAEYSKWRQERVKKRRR